MLRTGYDWPGERITSQIACRSFIHSYACSIPGVSRKRESSKSKSKKSFRLYALKTRYKSDKKA